jgi:AcrR family transcriptional regulator
MRPADREPSAPAHECTKRAYPLLVASTAQSPLRKDAARSRAAILTAARELLSSGRDVPMYEIGRHAGVGQATLYRHFPDRSAIVAAISSEHVDRIEATAAEHSEDDRAILIVLRAAADMLVSIHDLLGILREDATLAPVLDELRQRMLAVLDAALARSRPSQLLREDLRTEDLMLALSMINGALVGIATPAERTTAATRALELALDGLRHHPTEANSLHE